MDELRKDKDLALTESEAGQAALAENPAADLNEPLVDMSDMDSAPETDSLPADMPDQPSVKPKKKKKKWGKKRLILIIAVAAIIAVIAGGAIAATQKGTVIAMNDTTVLEYDDVQSTVGASGTVESANYNVYTTLSTLPVQEIYVADGDQVKEGDVLCLLDSETLRQQIATREAALGISAQAAALQVQAAQQRYDAAKNALAGGTNTTLINTQSAVDNAYNNWINAQKTYDEYRDSLARGDNAQLLSQQAMVDNASYAVEQAQLNYQSAKNNLADAESDLDDARDDLAEAKDAVKEAESYLDQAQSSYNQALAAYQSAKSMVDAAGSLVTAAQLNDLMNATTAKDNASAALSMAQSSLSAAKQAKATAQSAIDSYDSAISKYEDAVGQARISLESAKTGYENTKAQYQSADTSATSALDTYKRAADQAYQAYVAAQDTLKAANNAVQDELESYENALASSKVAAKNDVAVLELAALYDDLQDATVRAPVDGTVTAIYVKVGSYPPSLMFVIEDTDNLKVDTMVKEFDIGTVKVGMPVTIKSDATGDEVFEGKIISIAPTSAKDSFGDTATGSDVQFETEVAITSANTGLLIGMNVRLNYIVDEAAQVLTVPYEAVYTNDAGDSCVLAAMPQGGSDKHILQEFVVQTGLETDIAVVISGPGIVSGLRVINEPTSYQAGQEVTINEKGGSGVTLNSFGVPVGGYDE